MNKLVNSATMDGRPCGDLIATYNGTMRMLFFANGSTVKFGHLQSAAAITEYQGQEYDWIFMDEAPTSPSMSSAPWARRSVASTRFRSTSI